MDESREYLEQLFTFENTFSLEHDGEKIFVRDFMKRAVGVAASLRREGFRSGDRVVLALPNSPVFFELFVGCLYAGIIPALVSHNAPKSHLDALKSRLRAKGVLSSYRDVSYSIESNLETWVSTRTVESPAILLMSSGTTGNSKVIAHSLKSFFESAKSFANLVRYDSETRILHNWPMNYMAGVFNLFAVPLVSGSSVIVDNRFGPQTMGSFWDLVQRQSVTDILLTPTMIASLNKMSRFSCPDSSFILKSAISTSGPLYPSVAARFEETFGSQLSSCYGITEFGGSLSLASPPVDFAAYEVGQPVADISVRLNEDSGELEIKTPNLCCGYLDDRGELDPLDPSLFHGTGDIAQIRSGRLSIVGRLKDVIKRGGIAIALTEIEDLVHQAQLVDDTAAIASSDDFWGETYRLEVVPRYGTSDVDCKVAIERFLIDNLTREMLPESVLVVNQIRRTESGKAIRFGNEIGGRNGAR